jgi:hypothetical protein
MSQFKVFQPTFLFFRSIFELGISSFLGQKFATKTTKSDFLGAWSTLGALCMNALDFWPNSANFYPIHFYS